MLFHPLSTRRTIPEHHEERNTNKETQTRPRGILPEEGLEVRMNLGDIVAIGGQDALDPGRVVNVE
jgi:hypothetical protein